MEQAGVWLFSLKEITCYENEKKIYLNQTQMEMFSLFPGQCISLKVGGKESSVEVAEQTLSSSHDVLYCPAVVLNDFPFYQGERLRMIHYSYKNLVLGPAVGFTVSPGIWKNIEKYSLIKKRALLAQEKGILFYCFRLSRVDWEKNTVTAYCLTPDSHRWVKKTIPVPQVIYDRSTKPGPKAVAGYSARGTVEDIQWINSSRTFGKWETYQALKFFGDTAKYFPKTTLLSYSKLVDFLKIYEFCFIKSNFGRRGRQVYRVEKAENFYLCKKGGRVVECKKFSNLKKVCRFFRKTLGKKTVLQQGIFLSSLENCPFDMRILVQKNSECNWVISAVNFRIAAPGAVVTNFAAGSRDVLVLPGENLIHDGLSWDTLEHFVFQAVNAMEKYFGRLGEIGLDIGLDTKGQLWLFEANSRPSSSAYRDASWKSSQQIFGFPLDYAATLVKKHYENL